MSKRRASWVRLSQPAKLKAARKIKQEQTKRNIAKKVDLCGRSNLVLRSNTTETSVSDFDPERLQIIAAGKIFRHLGRDHDGGFR
jgi:hypothetical protein